MPTVVRTHSRPRNTRELANDRPIRNVTRSVTASRTGRSGSGVLHRPPVRSPLTCSTALRFAHGAVVGVVMIDGHRGVSGGFQASSRGPTSSGHRRSAESPLSRVCYPLAWERSHRVRRVEHHRSVLALATGVWRMRHCTTPRTSDRHHDLGARAIGLLPGVRPSTKRGHDGDTSMARSGRCVSRRPVLWSCVGAAAVGRRRRHQWRCSVGILAYVGTWPAADCCHARAHRPWRDRRSIDRPEPAREIIEAAPLPGTLSDRRIIGAARTALFEVLHGAIQLDDAVSHCCPSCGQRNASRSTRKKPVRQVQDNAAVGGRTGRGAQRTRIRCVIRDAAQPSSSTSGAVVRPVPLVARSSHVSPQECRPSRRRQVNTDRFRARRAIRIRSIPTMAVFHGGSKSRGRAAPCLPPNRSLRDGAVAAS